VKWRVVAASEPGSAHVQAARPCEDRCRVQVGQAGDGTPVLSIFVADGAGSAQFGGEGAQLAVDVGTELLSGHLSQAQFGLDEGLAEALLAGIRGRIEAQAQSCERVPRDFACTFLGVVSTPRSTLVMQIGDGGVVVDVGQGLQLAIEPMAGEYANTTHFVTDADAPQRLQRRTWPVPAEKVAAFSDGMQRLALDMTTHAPHEPLFSRLFTVMSAATPEQEAQLEPALVRLLRSAGVNDRTDDDKTLALAVRLA
jgi:hypothetical protein